MMRRAPSYLWASRLWKDCRGAAAVELALMVPLLMTLMFVSLEAGHFMFLHHQVVKGVRDGARFAGRQDFANFVCGTVTVPSGLETSIKNVTRTGIVAGGTSRVFGWDNSDIAVAVSCPATVVNTGIYSGLGNAPRVTVTATVEYPSLLTTLSGINVSMNLVARQQAAVTGV